MTTMQTKQPVIDPAQQAVITKARDERNGVIRAAIWEARKRTKSEAKNFTIEDVRKLVPVGDRVAVADAIGVGLESRWLAFGHDEKGLERTDYYGVSQSGIGVYETAHQTYASKLVKS